MFSVKSGDPDQINDDHIISKDVNRSTKLRPGRHTLPQDAVRITEKVIPEVGRKLDGENNVLLLFYFKEFYKRQNLHK